MSYLEDILVTLIVLTAVLVLLLSKAEAADYFIEVAGGHTIFKQYKQDGARFYQEAFPWSSDMTSPAGRLSVGQKLNDRWDYTLGWLVIGHNSVDAVFVSDAEYDLSSKSCLSSCDKPMRVRAYGDGRGPEAALRYNFEHVYIRSGLFLWLTRLSVQVWPEGDKAQEYRWQTAQHWMLTPFLGLGVKHSTKDTEVFADVSYYRVVETNGGYPLAKQAIVPMVGVRVNF